MDYKIALIRGDGIGPEVVGEAVKVLDKIGEKFGHTFTYTDVLLGGCAIDACGKPFPDDTEEKCKACDAVLLASGVARVNLIPGEEALVGRGVSYCATCDGMLYRDRPVAAVVLGAGFDEDVRFLQGICQVDVLTRPPRALRAEGERVILSTADSDTAYDCVFILRPAVALTTLLPALETADGAVRVDADMQTNIPGVFAAGDITGAPYQAARAVGQGNTAALSIARFLHQGDAINHESTN